MSRCETDHQGSYISWNAGWALRDVSSYDLPLEHFCQQKVGKSYFFFPSVPRMTAHYICQALGTELPWAISLEDIHSLQNLSVTTYPNHENCHANYWMSLTDEAQENVWRLPNGSVVDNIFWAPYEPNGIGYENCAALSRYGIADINCDMQIRCAVCTFYKQQRFSLLGICERELRNVYFVAYQRNISELLFIGYGEYHIKFEKKRWVWIDALKNATIARMEEVDPHYPMGRRWWNLEQEVCGQKSGRRMLMLSPCPPQHFTCDDATCIPIYQRCDLKYDCRDNSDEYECRIVDFPQVCELGM